MNKIFNSLQLLQKYIEQENYRGWDPYDALSSPLFKLPFFKSNKLIRFGAQQLVKRFPFNLRPILLIPKGFNPVTLGLMLQGYTVIYESEKKISRKDETLKRIDYLLGQLERVQSKGFSGTCWGYDFDWEARHTKILAFKPTVVATGFITNALYICHSITGNEKAKEMLKSSTQFVLKDLNRIYDSGNNKLFCFSYSPFDTQVVFNASMKGARILTQVYSITREKGLLEEAKNAIEFVVNKQNENGSWYYSMAKSGKFIDNYHTGYILDCLDEYRIHSKDSSYDENIRTGFEYYLTNFMEKGIPKFYNNKTYPIDCTSAAQSILTLTRFGRRDRALEVADFMINNMQNKDGYFYFRNYGSKINKTSFMRWSNAWMFAALSRLLVDKI